MTHAQRVNMRYHKTDGGTVTLMVGVIIPHPRFGMVCFHEFKQEGGPQEHEDCPSPVDTQLVSYLREQGVALFYAYNADTKTLYRAKVDDLAAAPLLGFATKTARVRHILARSRWETMTGVEMKFGARRSRTLVKNFSPLFAIPWCDRVHTLNER